MLIQSGSVLQSGAFSLERKFYMPLNATIVKGIMHSLDNDCVIAYLSTGIMPYSTIACANCPYAVFTDRHSSARGCLTISSSLQDLVK